MWIRIISSLLSMRFLVELGSVCLPFPAINWQVFGNCLPSFGMSWSHRSFEQFLDPDRCRWWCSLWRLWQKWPLNVNVVGGQWAWGGPEWMKCNRPLARRPTLQASLKSLNLFSLKSSIFCGTGIELHMIHDWIVDKRTCDICVYKVPLVYIWWFYWMVWGRRLNATNQETKRQ